MATDIVRQYQEQLYAKLTPEAVDCALELIHENPRLSGTHGSAILRKAIGDKSNLGESVYLQLLASVKGVIDRERKLHKFKKLLATNPADIEALS